MTRRLSRRNFLISGGALVVSFRLPSAFAQGPGFTAPAYDLDSFLAIRPDGSVTLSTSHVDCGTGILTAYRQIAAEELGIPVERFSMVEGDTAATPNHGGTGGSTGVPRGGADIRHAAATARQALLQLAATRLNCDTAELTIDKGEVRPAAGGKGVTVASLIGGRQFNLKVDSKVALKSPSTYTVVGKPILRSDVPAKSTGRHVYVQDHAVPGMLHGRVLRPPTIGAKLLSVDESSIKAIPGVRVVRIESFLGVVAPDEWAAIRAARELKAAWSDAAAAAPFATADLASAMGSAPGTEEQTILDQGDTTAALATASKKVEAAYYWPFQSHASLSPCCAIADVKDSGTTIWSSTQDTYGLRGLLAKQLGTPPAKVRVIYLDGSGSYGSNGAYDAAADAVLLSRAVGKPVRLQWMRHDEHGWDPKGPAQLLQVAGGLDKDGNLIAFESKVTGAPGPAWVETLLGPGSAGVLSDPPRAGGPPTTQNLETPYALPNMRVSSRALAATPIRISNLRAPGKIGNTFASEGLIDELAFAAGMDPVAFRRRGLKDPRALAVIDRAAAMIGWQRRPAHSAQQSKEASGALKGQGFAYIRYKQAETYVAMAMNVAVDRATGKIAVRHIACAHDCGLIINPDGLRNQVEGNILQTLSRTLHEEVTFAENRVTSTDWASYPILRFPEAPVVEVALIDHTEVSAWGAGEAASAPVAAALANAVFDATGVRLRTAPFTAARLKAAFA